MAKGVDVYQIVTDRVIGLVEEAIAAGEPLPWQRPWTGLGGAPANLLSKKAYRGINVFLLGAARYASPWWVTYRQASELGGQVRKGEKSSPVVFYKAFEDDDGDKKRTWGMLRYYSVFNVGQCDGLEGKVPQVDSPIMGFDPIEACEALVAGYFGKPDVQHGWVGASYSPRLDIVKMPDRERFVSVEGYYSTLFHELVHSTGHETRLAREGVTDVCPFGTTNYSKEELVAEMGAAMLCGFAGIENKTVDNSAVYVAHWLERLRNDRRMLVVAAGLAQKAVDRIIGEGVAVTSEEEAEAA